MGDPSLLGAGAGGFDTASGLSAISGLTQILGGVAANRQAQANADLAEELGLLAADDVRREGRALEGAQRAAATTVTGSALDIILADAVETEVDALRAKFGFDAAAVVSENQGTAALIASIVRGTGSVLGGIQRSRNATPRTRTPLGAAPTGGGRLPVSRGV